MMCGENNMKTIETEPGNHRMYQGEMKRGALEIAPLPEEGAKIKTIETELRKYRMCRAEMGRGCDTECDACPNNIPGSLMWRFSHIDAEITGETEI